MLVLLWFGYGKDYFNCLWMGNLSVVVFDWYVCLFVVEMFARGVEFLKLFALLILMMLFCSFKWVCCLLLELDFVSLICCVVFGFCGFVCCVTGLLVCFVWIVS